MVVVVVGKSRLWVGPKLKFADARSCAITCTRFPDQLCCRGPAVQSPLSDLTGRLTPPMRKCVCFAGPLRRCWFRIISPSRLDLPVKACCHIPKQIALHLASSPASGISINCAVKTRGIHSYRIQATPSHTGHHGIEARAQPKFKQRQPSARALPLHWPALSECLQHLHHSAYVHSRRHHPRIACTSSSAPALPARHRQRPAK